QISKTEFELILKKIDQELVKSNSEQLIQNSLASIGDFFNIGGVERNIVSPVAVEIYLKEKSLFDHLLKLRKGITEPSKKKYSIDSIKKAIYAEFDKEEKEEVEGTSVENDKDNLGELAEKHAQNLEKAGMDELINLEEEEALLALYEEDLKEDPSKEDFDFSKEEKDTEPVEDDTDIKAENENIEETIGDATEKEIVNEMMKDYFDDEVPEDKEETSGEAPVETQANKDEEVIIEKKPSTIEDELLEVFEGLDSDETEKQKVATFAPETEVVNEENSIESDEKIEIEEESSSTDEDSIINEIESATSEEENPSAVEREFEAKESEEQIEESVIRKKDLFSYLSRKETKKILSHIFLKDEEDFTNTVEKIMECGSYREASDILKSVFNSYKVSPYAKDAVNFTNAVSNYFRQA
ncbi:MAG: hypothetical protein KJO59_03655, partial [Ignavibacteria bacterium]|nr:hypothetical protein [Ignavibacteria bacterium]